MNAFEQLLSRLSPEEAETLRELEKRFIMAQALMQNFVRLEPENPRYGRVLLDYFYCVDEALARAEGEDDEGYGELNGY
ncbi:MAG: hypothetical protein KDC87_18445 [Planctomycetes bacterium]|nr:hypothetical protein [Planctomycetota bacterium]MCB9872124.1 hypothetical protein [Planctomycetota bacterium]